MIPWEDIDHLSPTGDVWSEDPDRYANPQIILAVDYFRHILGAPVFPSPVPGALARFDGSETSRHWVGDAEEPSRQSDALDIFCGIDIRTAYLTALTMRDFGAIGVYFDTHYRHQPHCLLHLDLRHLEASNPNQPTVIWYREDGEYHYPSKNRAASKRMLELLASRHK